MFIYQNKSINKVFVSYFWLITTSNIKNLFSIYKKKQSITDQSLKFAQEREIEHLGYIYLSIR